MPFKGLLGPYKALQGSYRALKGPYKAFKGPQSFAKCELSGCSNRCDPQLDYQAIACIPHQSLLIKTAFPVSDSSDRDDAGDRYPRILFAEVSRSLRSRFKHAVFVVIV